MRTAATSHWRTNAGVAVLILAAVLSFGIVVFLGSSVMRDLRLVDTAHSDNVQWSLAQAEVELLDFKMAATQAIADTGALAEGDLNRVRLSFDVFYSRAKTLKAGELYGRLMSDVQYSGAMVAIQTFLDRTALLMDGPDETLRANLPHLVTEIANLRLTVRAVVTRGLVLFATSTDLRRQTVSETLYRLAAVTALLLAALAFLAYHFNRLNQATMRAARDLYEAGERTRTILSTALDAVVVSDLDDRIIEVNEVAETILGLSRAELLGRKITDVTIPPEMRAEHEAEMAQIRRGAGGGRIIGRGRVRTKAMRAGGETFPAELSVQEAQLGGDRVFIAFLRDISTQIATEDALRRARDAAVAGEKAKADFLAVMSHEIRTPLNGLLGNLSLLSESDLNPGQRAHVRAMDLSGQVLLEHVSSVLDVTRLEAGRVDIHLAPVDLDAIFNTIVESQCAAARANGSVLDWAWRGPAAPTVLADAGRLRQILFNLVGNAIRFTPNGHISLAAEMLSDRDAPEGKFWVELSVSDTGVGIPAEWQSHIFEDFVTHEAVTGRPSTGTGLGLGIVRRLVGLMGGEVGFSSTPGRGSRFWVRLPLAPAAQGAMVDHGRPAYCRTSVSVLVVEDNDVNRQVLRDMLTRDGHEVTEAANGAEGVAMAAARRFDLILMDLRMPVMDGHAAVRAIRSERGISSDVPIYALTANVQGEGGLGDLRQEGFQGLLAKPLRQQELRDLIASLPQQPDQDHAPEASAVGPDEFGIDFEQNDLLRQSAGEGYGGFLERLAAEADAVLALPASDFAAISAQSHRLAGSMAMFGARACTILLNEMENAAKSADAAAVAATLGEFAALWPRTRQRLGEMRA